MNRYPLWKSLLFAGVMVLALLIALPNLFGQAPALQLSRKDGELFTGTVALDQVTTTLAKEHLDPDAAYIQAGRIMLRFKDVPTQLRARDAIDASAADAYAIATTLTSRAPEWTRTLGLKPMSLGLDLRGGIYLVYEVDVEGAVKQVLTRLERDYRLALREKKLQYESVEGGAGGVDVVFKDAATAASAQKVLEGVDSNVTLAGSPDGMTIHATLSPAQVKQRQDFAIQQNITALGNRVNALGVSEASVQRQGANRIAVQLPGVQDTARAKDILGRTASLEMRLVEAHASDPAARDYDPAKIEAAIKGTVPFGMELFYERRGTQSEPLLLSKQVIVTGERLTKASPTFDQRSSQPVVAIELDGQGARLMRDFTREAVKRRMAVLLVEKGKPEVITAPVIQDVLGGSFQITGSKTPREANDLALLLRAGALAAPMDIIEERTVGPSLGAENIKIGFHSTWIGFSAITVFMIVYYLMFGVISIVALAINVLFLVALLSMLQATLTLPGMAGIALTVGMAIDANVLIAERIREQQVPSPTPSFVPMEQAEIEVRCRRLVDAYAQVAVPDPVARR